MGFSGHQLAFWKVSSPLALRQAAQKTGCRSARTHHLAHCPLLNCHSGSRKTSCCGRTEAAEGRACASREHWGPCDSQDTIQGTQIRSGRSRPPAEALEIDRRWQAGVGVGEKAAPSVPWEEGPRLVSSPSGSNKLVICSYSRQGWRWGRGIICP